MRRAAFALLCLMAVPLVRADEWNKTFPITGKPDLRVETSDANIHVDAWDQNNIEARVTTEHYKIGENGIRVSAHQSGDLVQIEVRYPHHDFSFGGRSHRVEIEIHMPREGRVYLRTGDGSIHVSGCKGEIEAQSGDGHQEIEGVDGTLRAHAGDGRIHASGRFDGLEIRTGDGHIEARAQSGSAIRSSWNLSAGDGSVTLQVPADFAADVALHTSDGHISTDLPLAVDGSIREHSIHGKIGGGGRPLTIHTGDGSIRLEKS